MNFFWRIRGPKLAFVSEACVIRSHRSARSERTESLVATTFIEDNALYNDVSDEATALVNKRSLRLRST